MTAIGASGNERRNAAGTCALSPGIVPDGVRETFYRLAPITVKAAMAWIRETHRHLPSVQGGLFAVAVMQGPELVGVGLAANPARVWQGTGRIIIARVAVEPNLDRVGEHAAPVCTMIYGSLCRAARALGYREAWTYTMPGETGASLRGAGFIDMGETRAEEWNRPSRARSAAICAASKRRWMRRLSPTPCSGGRDGD